jgi:hypothetical protein
MLPVQAWPPGAPGRWGSPFSRPWLIDTSDSPCGLTVPKGVWLIHCRDGAHVDFRVRMDFGFVLPQPVRSPDPPPPPMWPPSISTPPPPPPTPWWKIFTLVWPHQTGTVWSDGQNVRVRGCGRAMLIQVFSA